MLRLTELYEPPIQIQLVVMSDPIPEPRVSEPKTPSGEVKPVKKGGTQAGEPQPQPVPQPLPQADVQSPTDIQALTQAQGGAGPAVVVVAQPPQQAQPGQTPWGLVLGWVNLSALDGIDPEKVSNSTAFKLGALAGSLPALSVMSLTKFLTPEQAGALNTHSTSWNDVLAAFGVLLSSALVGGAVAFFWAENRLRTIFTYGVAGPAVVLSMFLSGVGNLATNQKIEDIKKTSAQQLKEDTEKIQADAKEHLESQIQKVSSYNNVAPASSPPSSSQASTAVTSNPDLAPP